MIRSRFCAVALAALLTACQGDSAPGSELDAGNHQGGGKGDGSSGDGDAGDGDGSDASDSPQDASHDDDGTPDSGPIASNYDAGYTEAHCAPGVFVKSFAGDGPNHADRCDDQGWQDALQAGLYQDAIKTSLWDISLAVPMTAGKPYALSLEFEQIGLVRMLELWGTTGTCGAGGAKKLYRMPLREGTHPYCIEVTPTVGYTHVVIVQLDEPDPSGDGLITGLRSATFCATGTCQ